MKYKINIYSLLIVIGILQLVWPDILWLSLYRIVAIGCFVFMLLYLIAQFLMTDREIFGSNQIIKSNKTFNSLFLIRQASVLLVAWLINDPWALWLTVGLLILSIGIRFITLKRMNQ